MRIRRCFYYNKILLKVKCFTSFPTIRHISALIMFHFYVNASLWYQSKSRCFFRNLYHFVTSAPSAAPHPSFLPDCRFFLFTANYAHFFVRGRCLQLIHRNFVYFLPDWCYNWRIERRQGLESIYIRIKEFPQEVRLATASSVLRYLILWLCRHRQRHFCRQIRQ